MSIKIVPLGAGQDVGRSCILVSFEGKNVMLDCGMHMGYNDERRFPDFTYISKNGNLNEMIDCVVISHFHLDHTGALPYFTEMVGYDGPIYMTAPTKAICPLLLEDYRKIAVDRKGDSNFFTAQMVKDSMKKVITINLHESIKVCDNLEIKAYYAGHVLGAVLYKITVGNQSIVYTGDYNMTPDRHLGAAWIDKCKPDALITETTYATIIRESKRSREQDFLKKVHECVLRGGKVLIPVFALGRAQELCILIESYWERMGLKIPVYFSTGMTSKANNFYRIFISWTNEKIKKNFVERNMFDFKNIKPWENHFADNPGPMVLFASPGMLHAGTSLSVFKKWAPDPNNLVILPGYCVAGTVGSKVLAGDKVIEIDRFNKINVNLRVENLSFSAHADAKGIMQMISMCDPKNVIFVHGEKEKMKFLAKRIEEEKKIPVFYPPNGKTVTINTRRDIDVDISLNLIDKSINNYLLNSSLIHALKEFSENKNNNALSFYEEKFDRQQMYLKKDNQEDMMIKKNNDIKKENGIKMEEEKNSKTHIKLENGNDLYNSTVKKRKHDSYFINDHWDDTMEDLKLKKRKINNDNRSESKYPLSEILIENINQRSLKPIKRLPFKGVLVWDMRSGLDDEQETSLVQRSKWNKSTWYLNENKSDITYEVQGDSYQLQNKKRMKILDTESASLELGFCSRKLVYRVRKPINIKALLDSLCLHEINSMNENKVKVKNKALQFLKNLENKDLEMELNSKKFEKIENIKTMEMTKAKDSSINEENNLKDQDSSLNSNNSSYSHDNEDDTDDDNDNKKKTKKNNQSKSTDKMTVNDIQEKYKGLHISDQIIIKLKYYLMKMFISKDLFVDKYNSMALLFKPNESSKSKQINDNSTSSSKNQDKNSNNNLFNNDMDESIYASITDDLFDEHGSGSSYNNNNNNNYSKNSKSSSHSGNNNSSRNSKHSSSSQKNQTPKVISSLIPSFLNTVNQEKNIFGSVSKPFILYPPLSLNEIHIYTKSMLQDICLSLDSKLDMTTTTTTTTLNPEDDRMTSMEEKSNSSALLSSIITSASETPISTFVKQEVDNNHLFMVKEEETQVNNPISGVEEPTPMTFSETLQKDHKDECSILEIRSVQVKIYSKTEVIDIFWEYDDEKIAEAILSLVQ